MLVKDYLEYAVDMSINEINVHWCGHSEHVIAHSPVVKETVSMLADSSKKLYLNWREKIEKTVPSDLKVLTFR